jgi:hypothetical protein
LATPQAGFLVSLLFDSSVAQLLQERPPTLVRISSSPPR